MTEVPGIKQEMDSPEYRSVANTAGLNQADVKPLNLVEHHNTMKGIMQISSEQAPSGTVYLLYHKHIPGMKHEPPDPDIMDMKQQTTDPDMEQEPTTPDTKQEVAYPDMKHQHKAPDINKHQTMSMSAIFCADCNTTHLGICPVQHHLLAILDKPVSDADPHRAYDSLPDSLEIRQSGLARAGLGVWTREPQPEGVCFGPYRGDILTDMEQASMSGYAWEIRKKSNPSHYVDGKDESRSNWMRFVNCASAVEEQQNLKAFQYKEQIYYRITRDIPADTELLVWYGENYWDVPVSQMIKRDVKFDRETVALNTLQSIPYMVDDHDDHRTGCAVAEDELKTSTNEKEHKQKCCVYKKVLHRSDYGGFVISPIIKREVKLNKETVDLNTLQSNSYMVDDHNNHHTGCAVSGKELKSWNNENEDEQKLCVYKKVFTRSVNRNIHRRTHIGEKPHTCSVCKNGFSRSIDLKRHLRTHKEEKPYTCSVCKTGFSQSIDLQAHMRTHIGEKPHKCSVCKKGFSRSIDLQAHMRTHIEEKPYKCSVCKKGFFFIYYPQETHEDAYRRATIHMFCMQERIFYI